VLPPNVGLQAANEKRVKASTAISKWRAERPRPAGDARVGPPGAG
jgi:hypothetical protein